MILHRYVSHYIITYYLPSGMMVKYLIKHYIYYNISFEQIVYTFDKYLKTSIAILVGNIRFIQTRKIVVLNLIFNVALAIIPDGR